MKKLVQGSIKQDGTPYTPDEIKANNEFCDLVDTAVKEQTANMISKEEADKAINDAIKNQTAEFQDKAHKAYKAALEMGTQLAQMKAAGESITDKDVNNIHKQFQLQSKANDGAILTKAASEMILKTQYNRSSVTSNPMGMLLPDIGQIGAPRMGLYDLLPKVPVEKESNGVIRYIDITSQTRNAGATAEAGTYNESAIALTGKTLNLQKIGDSLPITEEVLRHTARIAAELELFLQTDMAVAIETQLATGSGVSPNLNGLYTSATTYTPTTASVQDASIYDLIVKMSEDITGNTSYGGKYMPNVVVMNIADINRMKLKKDKNNNYILPPFVSQDGKSVIGITVVENPFITANTCVLGDTRFARIYEEGTMESAYNYVNAEFLSDIVRLKIRKFMALLVRDADVTGWRKCTDIATALSTLNTGTLA